ncbi:phasin family protein [Bradyrhizobium sp. SYSU BS000235]|uniref:phasin family protein n=1 Tax=Bradyrhizobium sp. SYSU BS000235 TaxID=3411332 RepID=UPI003C7231A9
MSQGVPGARRNVGESNENGLTESTKLNAPESMFLQNFVHEWFEFFGKRTREHMHLIKTLQGCRSLPDLQRAYSEFWQNAFTQYVEEPRRMLRVTRGAVADASRGAQGNGAMQATLH